MPEDAGRFSIVVAAVDDSSQPSDATTAGVIESFSTVELLPGQGDEATVSDGATNDQTANDPAGLADATSTDSGDGPRGPFLPAAGTPRIEISGNTTSFRPHALRQNLRPTISDVTSSLSPFVDDPTAGQPPLADTPPWLEYGIIAPTSVGTQVTVSVAATPSQAVTNATDPVSDEADSVVNGDAARTTYDVDGTGIKVGIISDSFNALGGASADEADGALPQAADVHIVEDATGSGETDEGRAMAQIVHSIAPGAQIYFYTDGDNDQAMATAISTLQSDGCQIIIDDVFFTDEPFYEQGVISAAVNSVVADGSTYFTAANNASNSFYEGTFTPISTRLPGVGTVNANNFGTAASPTPYEEVTIPENLSVLIDLQWNQPFLTADGAASGPGSANSLAFALFNSSHHLVDSGTVDDDGGDPIQLAEYASTAETGSTFYLAVYENGTLSTTPGQFKVIIENDSSEPVSFQNGGTGSGSVIGHEEDPNAITVGAAPESDPSVMEDYSAFGPGELLFNSNGTALTSPVTTGKIDIVAPDGNSTSISGLDPFYGTSAATPAAAAVGALMLQANSALEPADVENILADTATPISGNANQTGPGLVNAETAVGSSETLTFDESASVATLLGTHLGATFVGGDGSHTLVGEGGTSVLDYEDAPAAVTVDFVTDTASNGFGGTDSFSDIQAADGSTFDDSFIAGSNGETLFGDGGSDSLNFAALSANGALYLTGGSFIASTSVDGTNAGTIDVENACTLQISGGTLVSNGLLEAQGGADLDIACAIAGTGTTTVGSGAILELGAADAEAVQYAGTPSTVRIDAPSSFSGALTGLMLGDVIDLVDTTVTATRIVGSTLSISLSTGSTLQYQAAGALAGNFFAITGDGSLGSDLILTALPASDLAQATIDTPSPISLGNARIGGTLNGALSITNSAGASGEALDASVASTTGTATGSGTISLLSAGETDSSDIVVGVSTASAGISAGSVTLAFVSDGSASYGNAPESLPDQTVQVTGAVYRDAVASVASLPANLIFHVGLPGTQPLGITNSAADDGYSEDLIGSVLSTTGGIAASGTTGDIAAQGTSHAIAITVPTNIAGTVSGSVTLSFESDGTGIDGLGTASLGQQTVAVNATVDNFAVAAIEEISGGGTWSTVSPTSYDLSLGTVTLGTAPMVIDLGVGNSATGPADLLSGSLTVSGGGVFKTSGMGSFAELSAGQFDSAPTVTFTPSSGGTFTETITLAPTGSNASGYSGALAPETLTITGTVATSISWAGPSTKNRSGDWNTAANWTAAIVPTAATTAVLGTTATYTVTSGTNNSVGALAVNDKFATLAVNAGTFSILGASTDTGTIAIDDGGTLALSKAMTVNGAIDLDAAGDATNFEIAGTVTLKGTGSIALGNGPGNAILSNGADQTFTNDVAITGSGTVGDSFLKIVNGAAGTIDGTGATTSILVDASTAISNSGLIESTGTGGLTVETGLVNSGGLAASAGILAITGAVTGTGTATISDGTLDFGRSVAKTQSVTFAQNSSGILELGSAQNFAGTVAGLGQGNAVDLLDFAYSKKPTITSVTAIMSGATQVGAAVTVKDGTLTATVDLLNQYGVSYSTNPGAYVLKADATSQHGTLLELAPPAA